MENLKTTYVVSDFPGAVRALAIENNYIYAGYDNGYIRIFENRKSILNKK